MWCRVDRVWVQPPAHAGSSLADLSTLKMEAIRSSEMLAYTRSTWCHIPEDGILNSNKQQAANIEQGCFLSAP
jgi:hypothetical protein